MHAGATLQGESERWLWQCAFLGLHLYLPASYMFTQVFPFRFWACARRLLLQGTMVLLCVPGVWLLHALPA